VCKRKKQAETWRPRKSQNSSPLMDTLNLQLYIERFPLRKLLKLAEFNDVDMRGTSWKWVAGAET